MGLGLIGNRQPPDKKEIISTYSNSAYDAINYYFKCLNSIILYFLKYRPENSSLEIVNHRKTQKLISTDLSNVVTQDAQVKHGTLQTTLQKSVKGTKNRGSPSNTRYIFQNQFCLPNQGYKNRLLWT